MPSFSSLAFSLIVAFSLSKLVFGAQQCYALTGELTPELSPCNNSTVSPCCNLGATNGQTPDTCMDSGLCLSYLGQFYQAGCTDKEYKSNQCAHICSSPQNNWGGGSTVKSWNVMPCNANQYCCRGIDDLTDCCANATQITTRSTPLGMPATATITMTANSTGVANSITTSGPTSASVKPVSSSNNVAAVGAGIGASLGALLAAALAVLFVMMRRQKKLRDELDRRELELHDVNMLLVKAQDSAKSSGIQIPSGPSIIAEKDARSKATELDGRGL